MKYSDRLTKLGLPTLELRRLHADLIFCYKIVFGYVSVNFDDFFAFNTVSTLRGHKYKLYKHRCTSSVYDKSSLLNVLLMFGIGFHQL